MRTLIFVFLFMINAVLASDQIPAPAQTKPILIKNGSLHTVSHGVLQDTDLLFHGGVITRIEKDIETTNDMTVIDATGKHVYPGLIAGVSALGLVEISAVRATVDYDEVGDLTPEVRANVSYNPDSEVIPVTRSNGVLFVNVTPRGGLIPGQSSLMAMDGWTWEDATFQHPTALHLNWPSMHINLNRNSKLTVREQEEKRRQRLQDLDNLLEKVRQYQTLQAGKNSKQIKDPGHDLRLEAMLPYVNGEKPVFIHARDVRQIEAAVAWSQKQNLKLVIVGGDDAWMVTELLQRHSVAVLVEGTLRLPSRRYSDYREAYALPAKLHDAGVSFCISTGGSGFAAAAVRDLPNHAAMAAAFGLPIDIALRSITLSAAEILDVSEQLGSLDIGKDASLFIATGDMLEITSVVEQTFIHGTTTDMSDKHKLLYKKYQEKYQRLDFMSD